MKNNKLQTNLSIIFDMAREYAEGGGTRSIEMENFNTAYDIIHEEIKKLEEYKFMYESLNK